MLLLLSKRCLRFLKALILRWVDGNQDIFSCAERGNNTQLVFAKQREPYHVCKECTGQITALQSTERGHRKGAGQAFDLSVKTVSEKCQLGRQAMEDELIGLDFLRGPCQKHFTH